MPSLTVQHFISLCLFFGQKLTHFDPTFWKPHNQTDITSSVSNVHLVKICQITKVTNAHVHEKCSKLHENTTDNFLIWIGH